MTAQNGALLLLKVGDGAMSETFATVGGMRVTALKLSNRVLAADTLGSGQWRALFSAAGMKSLSVTATGAFAASAAEETLRGYAFAGSANNYKMTFGNGHSLTGSFIVSSYERIGDQEREEQFSLTLESAGAVVFAA